MSLITFQKPGALAAPQLERVIAGARALDMEDVRREIAEQGQQSDEERQAAELKRQQARDGAVI